VDLDRKSQMVTEKRKKLLTIPESAERSGLKPATMRFWVWTRKIEHVKIGRAVRIPEHAIERIIEQGTVPANGR
jgi:excisionase family DNA binding protein